MDHICVACDLECVAERGQRLPVVEDVTGVDRGVPCEVVTAALRDLARHSPDRIVLRRPGELPMRAADALDLLEAWPDSPEVRHLVRDVHGAALRLVSLGSRAEIPRVIIHDGDRLFRAATDASPLRVLAAYGDLLRSRSLTEDERAGLASTISAVLRSCRAPCAAQADLHDEAPPSGATPPSWEDHRAI